MKSLILFLSLYVAVLARPDVYEFEQLRDDAKHWVFLVAGSNGYMNYRHQSDVCHAYQIAKKHGVPDEQIIVMMYDDIANNQENPVKGNIINRPNGQNVYTGVPKDYTKEEVNPKTFLNVLAGKSDEVNGKKVINSGPNDYIFVNFVDHGAPGILGFGDHFLKAKDMMETIKEMYTQKRYAKMVFYVEACESGSMFESPALPKDINVFATTASNAHESSYACYFDKTRRTYLGDVYSVKWMQDSDREDLNTETLQKQFLITKNDTSTSHVQEYGDMSISKMTVAEFLGNQVATPDNAKDPCGDAVKSEDVPLEILRRSLPLSETREEAAKIAGKIIMLQKERKLVTDTVKKIVSLSTGENHQIVTNILEGRRHPISDWDCYSRILDYLQVKCKKNLNIPMNDYSLRKLYAFVNMCELRVPVETMEDAIDKAC